MADPSRKEPSSPQKGCGSGSEGRSKEHTVIPISGQHGGSFPSPIPTPPTTQPPASHTPMAQEGLWGGRPMKKKAKMEKEAAVGMKVGIVEEPEKKKKFASLDNLPGRARTCSICRREFPTARALFGHMRSHPERIWRGAHPPPVSPRQKEKRLDVEQTLHAKELTSSLLNIGQMILGTSKFKEKEGFQVGISSSSGAVLTAHGVEIKIGTTKGEEKREKAIEVISSGSRNSSSSGDNWNQRKKNRTREKTGKVADLTDKDQRKRIHSQIDLNKEAPAEEDEEGEEETPGASSD